MADDQKTENGVGVQNSVLRENKIPFSVNTSSIHDELEDSVNKPPGFIAWAVTWLSLLAPILAAVCGFLGIQNGGNDIKLGWFITSFGLLVLGLVLSVTAHFWGLVKAFYPQVSMAWITVCGVGTFGGVVTLAIAIWLLIRMYGG